EHPEEMRLDLVNLTRVVRHSTSLSQYLPILEDSTICVSRLSVAPLTSPRRSARCETMNTKAIGTAAISVAGATAFRDPQPESQRRLPAKDSRACCSWGWRVEGCVPDG